ncbi:MAG: YihA family ribosome biogenesis GTP-binding protein [Gammaproteobacteria bacterium]|nr:YihA family ribosome biogenesis GTP-binding protein [Gammaproteobacteria bacterium]
MKPQGDDRFNTLAQARFLLSAARLAQLPDDPAAEVAFVGRSNAGKSSALNALCAQKSLARVSKTPGRTQLINLFALPGGERLVDLPGYGYAAVPEPLRRSWRALAGGYVERRATLRGLVLLMDVRHPLTPLDRQLLTLAGTAGRPVLALLTKADKLGRGARAATLRAVGAELDPAAATVGLFSVPEGLGQAAARNWIAARLGLAQTAAVSRPD